MKSSLQKHKPSQDGAQFLMDHGFKLTKSKLAVLAAFNIAKHPISAQEIAEQLPKDTANQVTIYRIIQSFKEKGILREVNLRHDHLDYELAHEEDDHHHLICVSCGLVEDFEECDADKLAKTVLKQSKQFSSVHEHALELFGVCNACAKHTK